MKPTNIWMVDDDEDQVLLAQAALQGLPVEIVHVPGARACLERLAAATLSHGPDLVLTDLNMPVMSGFELLERRLSLPALRAIPFIVLSSSSSPHDVRRCYELGCNAYVSRPVEFDRLRVRLRMLVTCWQQAVTVPTSFTD